MGRRMRVSTAGINQYALPILLLSLIIYSSSFIIFPKVLLPTYSEMLISLAFFIAISYFSGYSLVKGIFKSDDPLETHLMRLGFGLCVLPLLFLLMETAGVQLQWYIILGLVLVRPIFDIIRGFKPKVPSLGISSLKKPNVDPYLACALLISALAFTLALYGSYLYPYLEDGDPWEHAVGAKYVSLFGTYTPPKGVYVAHYLKPYPPSFDVLLGLIHQLNTSVSWTLKAFNSILVSLSYVFAYLMVKKLSGDKRTALFSTFVLFILPPFGSHSIWAHTMSAAILFPVIYSLDMVRQDKSWIILSSLFLAGSLLVQPLMSAVTGVFYACYVLARTYANKKELLSLAIVGAVGLGLSLIFWAPVALFEQQVEGSALFTGQAYLGVQDKLDLPTAVQLFFPQMHGDIFMQPGFGIIAILLAVLALDHMLRNRPAQTFRGQPWLAAISLWFILTILALLSGSFQISIYPTRFWGIVAIPMAILGGFTLANIGELTWTEVIFKHIKNRISRASFSRYVTVALVGGLLVSSGYPKITLQTSAGWSTDIKALIGADFSGYMKLVELPPNTPVFAFCTKDAYVIGMDKMGFPWNPDIVASRNKTINVDPTNLNTLLKSKGYKWVLFDLNCVNRCVKEENLTKEDCTAAFAAMTQKLDSSKLFTMRWRSESTSIFKVN
jgi:hypothetical protein